MPATQLRPYKGPVTNTDIWADFTLRDDDILVCTPPKCGTTWMLNLVMMLIHGKVVPDAGNSKDAPWLDVGFRDRQEIAAFLDGLTRRRCIKTHTPLDGIPVRRGPTYILVHRHPVDALFSMRKHAENMNNDWLDHLFAEGTDAGFARFLERDANDQGTDDMTAASFAHHYTQARIRADEANVHFFHYADLTRDPQSQIERLGRITGLPTTPDLIAEIAEATSFASMRKAVEASERRFHKDTPFHDLADFFNSGTSNKWDGQLSDAQMARYEARLEELLPDPQDRAWLNWGDRGAAN